MLKILFRADADPGSGTGDLLSLIYISGYFSSRRKYFISKDTAAARKIFGKNGIDSVTYIPNNIKTAEEIRLINNHIEKNGIDVIFIEITTRKISAYQAVRAPFRACVNFDGVIPENFDLVVNWDVGADRLYNKENYPNTRFLLGPRYVCLRKDILVEAGKRQRKIRKDRKIGSILVFFGGYDKLNFTLKSVKILKKITTDIDLNIIVGAGYNRKSELNRYLRGSGFSGHRVKQNISNMLREYKNTDLIITSGGLSLSEAVALKIPVIAVPLCRHQIKRSAYFGDIGVALCAGFREEPVSMLEKAINGWEFGYFRKNFMADKIPGIVYEKLGHKKRA